VAKREGETLRKGRGGITIRRFTATQVGTLHDLNTVHLLAKKLGRGEKLVHAGEGILSCHLYRRDSSTQDDKVRLRKKKTYQEEML